MKYVLILILAAKGGSGMSMWAQPAMVTAEFATQAACEGAALTVTSNAKKIERETQLDFVRATAFCVPVGQAPQ